MDEIDLYLPKIFDLILYFLSSDLIGFIAADKISSFNLAEVSIFFFMALKAFESKHFKD